MLLVRPNRRFGFIVGKTYTIPTFVQKTGLTGGRTNTAEKERSDIIHSGLVFDRQHVIAQYPDLALHLKRGQRSRTSRLETREVMKQLLCYPIEPPSTH